MKRRLSNVQIGVILAIVCVLGILIARQTWKPPSVRNDDFSRHGLDINQVYEYDCLSEKECKALINAVKERQQLNRSTTVCEGGKSSDCTDPGRTSRGLFLDDDAHPVVDKISSWVESLLKIDRSHFEPLQVVHYKGPTEQNPTGEQYVDHYDACDFHDKQSFDTNCDASVHTSGQRFATVLIYLNDDMVGGNTCFPLHNGTFISCGNENSKKITPRTGRAVLFFNVEKDGTTNRRNSLHAGMPPKQGEKWVCNKWIRTGTWKI